MHIFDTKLNDPVNFEEKSTLNNKHPSGPPSFEPPLAATAVATVFHRKSTVLNLLCCRKILLPQLYMTRRFTRKSWFLFTTADQSVSLESLFNILMMIGMITLRCFLLILVPKLVLCFRLTLLTRRTPRSSSSPLHKNLPIGSPISLRDNNAHATMAKERKTKDDILSLHQDHDHGMNHHQDHVARI
nr:hypothetical protein [Tanacetum cinerariifolium]